MIAELIDKQDGFEIVRDMIATIITTEFSNQRTLAATTGKDPNKWDARVFSERFNPWEQYLNTEEKQKPIINIWYDNSNFPENGSNVMERQKTVATYNIDCIGFGIASGMYLGHEPSDIAANNECQRTTKLLRNILMAAEYTYLGLRGTVWTRWINSITMYQPPTSDTAIQRIKASRILFTVTFNEFSPQIEAQAIEYISGKVSRNNDGKIIINADYDYTP